MNARGPSARRVAEHAPTGQESERDPNARLGWLFAGLGVMGLVIAVALHPPAAGSAAAQDWPPFVLVAGLLLIGLVAHEDGLFAPPATAWRGRRRAAACCLSGPP